MAWNDKPTDAQTGALINEYEPYVIEELDFAKETGAVQKQIALEALSAEDVITTAVLNFAETSNRYTMSKLIGEAQNEYYIEPSIKQKIDNFLSQYGVELDYERLRNEWREQRKRCQRG